MKKILYIDMDGVLVDFESGLTKAPQETREMYKDREDEIPGIYALMDPMPGAIEAFHRLAGMYDTYILSTAPWENPSAWSDKLLWVKRHLGKDAHKRLILTHHKNLNSGDYLVDDRDKNGAGEFEGELLRFNSERFPDWAAVLHELTKGTK